MFRKLIATALAVSFIAIATSGMMMFFVEKPSFTLQMHPVHKLFGLVIVVSAIAHIGLNNRALKNHLRSRAVSLFGATLVVALTLLYGVVINNEIPKSIAEPMDALATQAESLHKRNKTKSNESVLENRPLSRHIDDTLLRHLAVVDTLHYGQIGASVLAKKFKPTANENSKPGGAAFADTQAAMPNHFF